jgi:hypothetical protein
VDECIKKMWYVYTIVFYLAIKKNEIMPFAGKVMEQEIIMLSEISQSHKIKYHIYFLSFGEAMGEKLMKVKGGILLRWKGKGKWRRVGRTERVRKG